MKTIVTLLTGLTVLTLLSGCGESELELREAEAARNQERHAALNELHGAAYGARMGFVNASKPDATVAAGVDYAADLEELAQARRRALAAGWPESAVDSKQDKAEQAADKFLEGLRVLRGG